jgi:hypothetical protein
VNLPKDSEYVYSKSGDQKNRDQDKESCKDILKGYSERIAGES